MLRSPLPEQPDRFLLELPCELPASSFSHGRLQAHCRASVDVHKTRAGSVRVNQLERSIRKNVVAHLTLPGNTADVPYCLLLMSLVKDVERIGDYAKNLAELVDIRPEPVPDDEILHELQEIRRGVEDAFQSTWEIFASSDEERAMQYIRQGRDLAHRCETLILRIARASYDASTTAVLVLCTRYYKRIGGHAINVLSSVVMPLHKVDYYDEDEIPQALKRPPA